MRVLNEIIEEKGSYWACAQVHLKPAVSLFYCCSAIGNKLCTCVKTQQQEPGSRAYRWVHQASPKSHSPSVPALLPREVEEPVSSVPSYSRENFKDEPQNCLLLPSASCSFCLHLLLIRTFILIEYSSYVGTNCRKEDMPPPPTFPNEWRSPQSLSLYCVFSTSSRGPGASSSDSDLKSCI